MQEHPAPHNQEFQNQNLEPLHPDQQYQIQDNFDVLVVPVRHGVGLDHNPQALQKYKVPSDEAYIQMEDTVDAMVPGDVLLCEAPGFIDKVESLLQTLDPNVVQAVKNVKHSQANEADHLLLKAAQEKLQDKAIDQQIDAIEYGWQYAYLRGIEVVAADLGIGGLQEFQDEMTKLYGKAPSSEQMAEQFAHLQSLREDQAVNTVKDTALNLLDIFGDDMAQDMGRKRKLTLIYGRAHAEQLENKLSAIGINAEVAPDNTLSTLDKHRERVAARIAYLNLAQRAA